MQKMKSPTAISRRELLDRLLLITSGTMAGGEKLRQTPSLTVNRLIERPAHCERHYRRSHSRTSQLAKLNQHMFASNTKEPSPELAPILAWLESFNRCRHGSQKLLKQISRIGVLEPVRRPIPQISGSYRSKNSFPRALSAWSGRHAIRRSRVSESICQLITPSPRTMNSFAADSCLT